ncbi:3-carboxy-cis,cis-muconate cycloisomerase [Afifella sp. IM 167]|uniref:3-carboxy-cis,cis-muconate cycloisomerase n=1 Tax=Afifella sp. IM 167 TaxID=2033586 RepID=UPI001CCFFCB5|nr:3-carboxy-cis,cis-muconate cycloisomerase [Afifella sp. IM 167]MBZ8134674.1 3-carboxy-cis,cis-muconate cycloisomerase [Afifella sp. IM 167]
MNDEPADERPLLASVFSSQEMRALFADRAVLQAMLDVEAALARAEEKAGIIPSGAADSISRACDASLYDLSEIGRAAGLAGNVAIPLVKALTAKVDGPGKGYVHWGATSQDVIDTAFMLLAGRALRILLKDLANGMSAASALAERHRGTVMAGRTWLQQALPIPFGLKAAIWLSGLTAAFRELARLREDGLAIQFAGAAGTLASLGDRGPAVRATLATELGLPDPGISWHAERSRILDLGAGLAGLSGSLAKIAIDVQLMMQSEIGEAFEPAAPGKGGSSTMPQKRNPVGSAAIRANHRRICGLLATLAMAMEGEHERSPGAWPSEWETLRDVFLATGGSLEKGVDIVSGLEIDADAMRRNLQASGGFLMAESLMMRMAGKLGRGEAHHLVAEVARTAMDDGRSLREAALEDARIGGVLSAEEVEAALRPESYLGSSHDMIDRAVQDARAAREETHALL